MRFALVVFAAFAASPEAVGMPFAVPSTGAGLTGTPSAMTTDFLPRGAFAVGASLGAWWPEGREEPTIVTTVAGAAGISDRFELGAAVPVYPSDGAWERDHLPGDLSIAGRYLYEEARGGTGLAFTCGLRLPTGSVPRDRGSALSAGICTSTTYRLFRLSLSAAYGLAGGEEPFEDGVDDEGAFSCTGTSFMTPDLQICAGAAGNTSGRLAAVTDALYSPLEGFFTWFSASGALQGDEGFILSAGVSALL